MEEPLREPDAACIGAVRPRETVAVREDELRRATADVDDERACCDGVVARDASQHHLGLLAAVEESRGEAVAPLDLPEERLTVVCIPHGARADCEHTLGTQPLGLPAIVDEDVSHARDGRGEEDPPPVDRLAEPRDLLTTDDLLEVAVFEVGDEQASRVRAEVDGGDAHALTLLGRDRGFRGALVLDAGQEPEQPAHRVARLADRLQLHFEPCARRREARGCVAETCVRRIRAIHLRLDLGRDLGDPLRLDGERPACSLEPPPQRDPAQHGIRDPAHDADEEHRQRDPEAGHRVLR